jgi:hypothetical protein
MNFYHVYWSKPANNKRWNIADVQIIGNLWLYSLSVAYLKRLGQTINLYTDSKGKELLGHLPYDNIYTILDDIPSDIPDCCWAYGKIFTMPYVELGDVYIDGDVFIKSEKCIEKLKEYINYDGYFAGIEDPKQIPFNMSEDESGYHFHKLCWDNIYWDHNCWVSHYDFPNDIPIFGKCACNGGVIIFNNKEYKHKFVESYEYMLLQLKNDERFLEIYKDNKHLCIDLIFEQRFLYELGKNYKMGFLLDYYNRDEDHRLTSQADAIGFQHIIGSFKYTLIDKYKYILKNINPDIYEETLKVESKIA